MAYASLNTKRPVIIFWCVCENTLLKGDVRLKWHLVGQTWQKCNIIFISVWSSFYNLMRIRFVVLVLS